MHMKFGIATFVTDNGIAAPALAQAVEERGFEFIAVAEHTHIPAHRQTPFPLGGELPEPYYRTLDPFVTLAAAAAVTSTIELITAISLLTQRDPIITAKEAASIDLISRGRFVFGVGVGWNFEELRNHGTDPKTRGRLFDERLEAIKAIWIGEPAEYHGDFVDFDPVYSRPKPVHQPHPPILIGGGSNAAVGRIVRHRAGWISIPLPEPILKKRIHQIRASAGHDASLAMVFAPDEIEYWSAVADLGFVRLGLNLPTQPLDTSLRLLDDYAVKVAKYRG
jgi:probable F420-dependent oxidoreductase